MHNTDIADLLRRALRAKGCTEAQVGSFDMHSNIELELLNMPSLNLEKIDDDLWFWAEMDFRGDASFESVAPALLKYLMDGARFSRTGQMQMVRIDHRLNLRSPVGMTAFDDEHTFGQALEEFLAAIEVVTGILGR